MPDTAPFRTPGLVLVTGPAGSGRTTALRAFEDLGFEAIDNMPLSLVARLVQDPLPRPLALGIDTRNRDFAAETVLALTDSLRAAHPGFDLLFLSCGPDTLVRRFSETRRSHPLLPDRPVRDGIALEGRLLSPIAARADTLIATDDMTPHDLRAEIQRLYRGPSDTALQVQVMSFAYRRGLPNGADLVFDCRFLRNPHWDDSLRAQDGRHADVQAYIDADPHAAPFFHAVAALVESLLPAFAAEGRAQLTIAFGCTGGKHRSVAFAERLANRLAPLPWPVSKRHRELERATPLSGPALEDKVRT